MLCSEEGMKMVGVAVVSARRRTELDRPEVAGITVADGMGAVTDFHTVVRQTAFLLIKQFMVGKGTL